MRNIFCVCILLFYGAVWAQPAGGIREIELSKVSRGYEEHIRVTADSLHVFIENKMGEKPPKDFSRKMTAEEWKNLAGTLEGHPVKELKDLPSPTMKRAHDAAMHSTITIHTADGASVSHGYDDENPHGSFLPLLKAIRVLSGVQGKP
jgi:hypothetical protein